jgi:hypothetical protein
MGSLVVTSNVPGADVFIDGKRVGMSAEFEESATPIQLVAGNYIVAVRKDGYEKEDAVKVTIEGNNVAKLHVDMVVAQDPEAIAKAVRIAGYSSLGVGVASLIAGGVFQFLVSDTNEEIDNKIKDGISGNDYSYTDNFKLVEDTYKPCTIAFYAAGGFLTAAGIALTVVGFVHDFAGEDVEANNAMPKIDFNVTPEYQGMTMGWRF